MREDQREKLKKIILDLIKDPSYHPMKEKELCFFLGVPKEEKAAFQELLMEMQEEGVIGISLQGKYSRAESFSQKGTFHASRRGFGFVSLSEKEEEVYIPKGESGNAMDGDLVRVILTRRAENGSKAEGKISKVLERANKEVLGLVKEKREGLYLSPDNPKLPDCILISPGRDKGAVPGDKVIVEILSYGATKENKVPKGRIPRKRISPLLSCPIGEVKEILGHKDDPGMDVLSVIRSFSLPEEFPEDVLLEANQLPNTVSPEKAEEPGRKDFRKLTTITIDGEDAKDLDDAISLEYFPEKKEYRLYVHIADVSDYVKEGSALDLEALERGTSVYLTDRVIPMLPKALSNGICSLHEGVDRLCLSCIMDFDREGRTLSHEITPSVICSDKRMSYHKVTALLEDKEWEDPEEKLSYLPFHELLTKMRELARLLRKTRMARGALDFDFPESKVYFDENGNISKICAEEREESHKIIEEFMLIANETVAEEYYWRDIPFLYRIHEKPDWEKWQNLSHVLSSFSYSLKAKDPDNLRPKALQELLSKMKGKPEEAMLSSMILRSLKQAKYSTEPEGHFGLASKYYSHFTSPIRRYPDLQIHRIIKENIAYQENEKRRRHYERILPDVASQSSLRERRAEEAERDCMKLKKCQYMKNFLGEVFPGRISGLTQYGIYVTLENSIEGMIPLRFMTEDYYIFNEEEISLRGEASGKTFHMGDPMWISVYAVDTLSRSIDFLPYYPEDAEGGNSLD